MRIPGVRFFPPLLLFLCATTAIVASSNVVDLKGRLIAVEAATAITTEGTTVSVLKIRQNAKDGSPSEEIVPETADAQADLAPQALMDPVTGDLVLIWSRFDGRHMTLAATRRDPSGAWSPLTYLDTGKGEPAGPEVALDDASRLHVLWKVTPVKTAPELRHRAFDLGTFQPIGDVVDPFAEKPAATKGTRAEKTGKGAGTAVGQPAREAGASPGLTVDEGRKGERFSAYGVESGCDAAVVFRVSGKRLEVASIFEGKWQRGDVAIGGGGDPATVRGLVADIARRFCQR